MCFEQQLFAFSLFFSPSPVWFFLTVLTGTGGAPYPGGAEGASDDLGATPPPRAVIERKARQKRDTGGGGRRGRKKGERR